MKNSFIPSDNCYAIIKESENCKLVVYQTVFENGKKDIILDPKRAFLVKRAFELFATGQYSLLTLAELLEKEGIGITNTTFHKGELGKMLNNPFYYGEMRYKDQIYPHKYEPLITRRLFDKVQEVLRERRSKPFKYASVPTVFRGLITCAKCGRTVTADRAKGKYIYYHCTAYRNNCEKIYNKESA